MADVSLISVQVTHRYAASAERVFDAWLDPAMIGRFMFGPHLRDERIVRLQVEPKVGGEFSFVVERQGHEIDHLGTYLEIERPRRLAFTWGIREHLPEAARVTIEISPVGAGCELTLTHQMDSKWAEWKDRVSAGWTMMATALERELGRWPAPS
jgi:uncharacterized protein YndB with AHSA1/START domain